MAEQSNGAPVTEDIHIPIAQLTPLLSAPATRSIKAIVTLTWPYSSATDTIAFLLSEPDFRLRRTRGQVRVQFSGSSANRVARAGIASGDEVVLCLDGVEFLNQDSNSGTPGRGVEFELRFKERLKLQFKQEDSVHPVIIDIDSPSPEQTAPKASVATLAPEPSPEPVVTNGISSAPAITLQGPDEWSSPAFLKRARTSYGSLFDSDYDPFSEDDGTGTRKRRRTRLSSTWRVTSRSPTPEVEDEVATPIVEESVAQTTPMMLDEACQTTEMEAGGAAEVLAEFARQATNIGSTSYLQSNGPKTPPVPSPTPAKLDNPEQSTLMQPPRVLTNFTSTQTSPLMQHAPSSPRLRPIPSNSLPLVSPLVYNSYGPNFLQALHAAPEAATHSHLGLRESTPVHEEDIYEASPIRRRAQTPRQEPRILQDIPTVEDPPGFSVPSFPYATEDQYGHWQSINAQLSRSGSPVRNQEQIGEEVLTEEAYNAQLRQTRSISRTQEHHEEESLKEAPFNTAFRYSGSPPRTQERCEQAASGEVSQTSQSRLSESPMRVQEHVEEEVLTDEKYDHHDQGAHYDEVNAPHEYEDQQNHHLNIDPALATSVHYPDLPSPQEVGEDMDARYSFPPARPLAMSRSQSAQSPVVDLTEESDEDEEMLMNEERPSQNESDDEAEFDENAYEESEDLNEICQRGYGNNDAPRAHREYGSDIDDEYNGSDVDADADADNEAEDEQASQSGRVYYFNSEADDDEEAEFEVEEPTVTYQQGPSRSHNGYDDDLEGEGSYDEDELEDDEGDYDEDEMEDEADAQPPVQQAPVYIDLISSDEEDGDITQPVAAANVDHVSRASMLHSIPPGGAIPTDEDEDSGGEEEDVDDGGASTVPYHERTEIRMTLHQDPKQLHDEQAQDDESMDDQEEFDERSDDDEAEDVVHASNMAQDDILANQESEDSESSEAEDETIEEELLREMEKTDVLNNGSRSKAASESPLQDPESVQEDDNMFADRHSSASIHSMDGTNDEPSHTRPAVQPLTRGLSPQEVARLDRIIDRLNGQLPTPDTTQETSTTLVSFSSTMTSQSVNSATGIEEEIVTKMKTSTMVEKEERLTVQESVTQYRLRSRSPVVLADEEMVIDDSQRETGHDDQSNMEGVNIQDHSTKTPEDESQVSIPVDDIEMTDEPSVPVVVIENNDTNMAKQAMVDGPNVAQDDTTFAKQESVIPSSSKPELQSPESHESDLHETAQQARILSSKEDSEIVEIAKVNEQPSPNMITRAASAALESEAAEAMDTEQPGPNVITRAAAEAMEEDDEGKVVDSEHLPENQDTHVEVVAELDSPSPAPNPIVPEVPRDESEAEQPKTHAEVVIDEPSIMPVAEESAPPVTEVEEPATHAEVVIKDHTPEPSSIPIQARVDKDEDSAEAANKHVEIVIQDHTVDISSGPVPEKDAERGTEEPEFTLEHPRRSHRRSHRRRRSNTSSVKTDEPRRPVTPVRSSPVAQPSQDQEGKQSPIYSIGTPSTPRGHDASIALALQSLDSPSKNSHNLRKPPVVDLKVQLSRVLRTELSEFTTLKVLRYRLTQKLDFLAIATTTPPEPQRSKGGPRQYQITFNITDPSIAPSAVTEVQVFRPYSNALPTIEAGDAVLLRNFQVVSVKKGGFALRSTQDEASSWAVFKDNIDDPEIRGPPVEYGDGEKNYISSMKEWYDTLDETAQAKISRANGTKAEAGH